VASGATLAMVWHVGDFFRTGSLLLAAAAGDDLQTLRTDATHCLSPGVSVTPQFPRKLQLSTKTASVGYTIFVHVYRSHDRLPASGRKQNEQ